MDRKPRVDNEFFFVWGQHLHEGDTRTDTN